jgi:hypothetical protein
VLAAQVTGLVTNQSRRLEFEESWVGGIGRESMTSKKIAETALEYAPKADVERFLLLMDKLYTSSIVGREAIKR